MPLTADLILWVAIVLIVDLLVGRWAEAWGRSFSQFFLLSFLLSPIAGGVILLLQRPVKTPAPPAVGYCPSCGTGRIAGANFCASCGRSLEAAAEGVTS